MSFFKKLLGREDVSNPEKEAKKNAEMQHIEKYFGKADFVNKMNFSVYKKVINYFEQYIIMDGEQVLAAIPAEYDKTEKREMKGMLIATSERLIFVTSGIGHGEFVEQLEYKKMNGITLAPDGFTQKELLIDLGRSRKVFDDIINNDPFKRFITIVREKMLEAKRQPSTTQTTSNNETMYEKLAQLGKLRDDGILTEEEFNIEKQKVLNS